MPGSCQPSVGADMEREAWTDVHQLIHLRVWSMEKGTTQSNKRGAKSLPPLGRAQPPTALRVSGIQNTPSRPCTQSTPGLFKLWLGFPTPRGAFLARAAALRTRRTAIVPRWGRNGTTHFKVSRVVRTLLVGQPCRHRASRRKSLL